MKSAVLNAELPQNSRIHILEVSFFPDVYRASSISFLFLLIFFPFVQEFNAGLFDYLIATDDSHAKEKEQLNKENKSQSKNSKRRLKQNLDSEFGVVRGIDFKNVYTVGVDPFLRGFHFQVETSAELYFF
jgi:ATP-dependent RNA helicase DDX56/DBP9